MNLSLLLHTFNGYEFVWDGFLSQFHKHWSAEIPLYFGTNTENHDKHDFNKFKVIYSGTGEWSTRLVRLIDQIDTEYVLYMQEDFYLKDSPPSLGYMMNLVKKYDLYRLQISPIVQFYSLYGSEEPFFFHEQAKSKYLVCHQPSIWKKDFLLSCLERTENPWDNEYYGTCRLWERSDTRKKIAIYPCDWYDHMVSKGSFIKKA